MKARSWNGAVDSPKAPKSALIRVFASGSMHCTIIGRPSAHPLPRLSFHLHAGEKIAIRPRTERLKQSITAWPTQARLGLMEWLEAAVALRQPRTTAAIESLQLEVLHLPPDDMLDLSQWIMDITFEKQPAPLADAIDRAVQQLGLGA